MISELTLPNYVAASRTLKWRGSLLQQVLVSIADAPDEEWSLKWAFALGERWAAGVAAELDPEADFEVIAAALNLTWREQDWGVVAFLDGATGLEIVHVHGPFVELLGKERLLFAAELMRGFYRAILRTIGGSDGLELALNEARSGVERLVFVVEVDDADR